jgi:hypothetical protein
VAEEKAEKEEKSAAGRIPKLEAAIERQSMIIEDQSKALERADSYIKALKSRLEARQRPQPPKRTLLQRIRGY